ncbi:MAG: lysostaphin resistance A-like protein [Myxococcota bacterium]
MSRPSYIPPSESVLSVQPAEREAGATDAASRGSGGPPQVSWPPMPLGPAMLLFAGVGVLVLALGPLLIMKLGLPALLVLQTVLIGAPSLLYVHHSQRPAMQLLPFRALSAQALLGTVMLGLSVWYVLLGGLLPLQERLFPVPEAIMRAREQLFAPPEDGLGWLLLWASAALTPAVFEELLFRGALLQTFLTRLTPWVSVVLTAAMFALFHFNPYQLSITFFQGVLMGWLVLRTRSLLGGVVFHLFNNSIVLLFSTQEVAEATPAMLSAMLLLALVGAWMVNRSAPASLPRAEL